MDIPTLEKQIAICKEEITREKEQATASRENTEEAQQLKEIQNTIQKLKVELQALKSELRTYIKEYDAGFKERYFELERAYAQNKEENQLQRRRGKRTNPKAMIEGTREDIAEFESVWERRKKNAKVKAVIVGLQKEIAGFESVVEEHSAPIRERDARIFALELQLRKLEVRLDFLHESNARRRGEIAHGHYYL